MNKKWLSKVSRDACHMCTEYIHAKVACKYSQIRILPCHEALSFETSFHQQLRQQFETLQVSLWRLHQFPSSSLQLSTPLVEGSYKVMMANLTIYFDSN